MERLFSQEADAISISETHGAPFVVHGGDGRLSGLTLHVARDYAPRTHREGDLATIIGHALCHAADERCGKRRGCDLTVRALCRSQERRVSGPRRVVPGPPEGYCEEDRTDERTALTSLQIRFHRLGRPAASAKLVRAKCVAAEHPSKLWSTGKKSGRKNT